MKKLTKGIISAIAVIALAAAVYAFAWDTDGGFNIYEAGTCYVGNDTNSTGVDSCSGSWLQEWFTDSNNTYCGFEYVHCNLGCKEGACKEMLAWDTDNGFNVYERGTCYTFLDTNNSNTSATDYCYSDEHLLEFFPDDEETYCLASTQICTNGCSQGACQRGISPTNMRKVDTNVSKASGLNMTQP